MNKYFWISFSLISGTAYTAYRYNLQKQRLNRTYYSDFILDELQIVDNDLVKCSLKPKVPLQRESLLNNWSYITICNPYVQAEREFSPLTRDLNDIKLFIRTYNKGTLGSYIRRWKPGDTIRVRGPHPVTNVDINQYSRIIAVIAGTGIAPILQLAHFYKKPLEVIYFVRNNVPPFYKDELEQLSSNADVQVIQNRPLTASTIASILHSKERESPDDVLFLICGNDSFVQKLVGDVPWSSRRRLLGEPKGILSSKQKRNFMVL
ncbi:NADH-cytochrome reductase [Schizosaccharomyces japonicus yFS275]|uniref:NADH-cytochrome reductase n=1 Tax=Schizosaccharomyces japonicus (strain yFS275 / FY16936) TaxID=402676 RepID=B6K4A3_SCHJY|nr:NADH-cytochrome reductase [Schizosaccharomyces japonicus yFS275]EEB08310.1 NADH-cytochrome reductase [Schizosaccharomyces japonicus yFS275]